jgi:prophage regulatory protein
VPRSEDARQALSPPLFFISLPGGEIQACAALSPGAVLAWCGNSQNTGGLPASLTVTRTDRSVYYVGGAMEDTGQLRVGLNAPRQAATGHIERVKRAQRVGTERNVESGPTFPHTPVRLIRLRDVRYRTGLSRTTIWRLERRNAFPKHRQISSNAVGWIEHEVTAWIESRAMVPDVQSQQSHSQEGRVTIMQRAAHRRLHRR